MIDRSCGRFAIQNDETILKEVTAMRYLLFDRNTILKYIIIAVCAAASVVMVVATAAHAQEPVTFFNKTGREVFVFVQYGPSSDGSCQYRQYNKRFLMESGEFRRWNFGPGPICYCYSIAEWPRANDCDYLQASPGQTIQLR